MQIFRFFLLLAIIISCKNSSSVRIPTVGDNDAAEEFHIYLKEGEYKVEYYPSKEVTTEHKKLLQKLSKLIETNTITQNYFRKIENGESPAYNSNIGISKQEYNRLIDLFSYKAPTKQNGTLIISRDENRFIFKGDKRLALLDSVSVGKYSISAFFKQYKMNRVQGSIDLSSEDIPEGETLETYEFYNGPEGLAGLMGLNGVYELLIGKLMPSGRTYLSFFARYPSNIEYPLPEYITVIIPNK